MADYVVTINESIGVYGPELTNRWGTMLWGQRWAYGDFDLTVDIGQSLDDSPSINTFTITDEITAVMDFVVTINESLSCADGLDNVTLQDANGYYYTFQGPTTSSEDATSPTYTQTTATTTSWSAASQVSTSWSEA